MKDNFMIL